MYMQLKQPTRTFPIFHGVQATRVHPLRLWLAAMCGVDIPFIQQQKQGGEWEWQPTKPSVNWDDKTTNNNDAAANMSVWITGK